MPLFHSSASVICADYFGDELPLPLPAVKILGNKKKKMNSKDTTAAAKILNVGAATDNAVGQSKKGSSKYKAPGFTLAFDGLHPFEMFVSRR